MILVQHPSVKSIFISREIPSKFHPLMHNMRIERCGFIFVLKVFAKIVTLFGV